MAPGWCASFRRSRAMTRSAEIFRWAMGFRTTKKNALLRWPPPVKATTWSTAGSAFTMATKLTSFCLIAWKEMLWSATRLPMMRPVSCWGMNPLGTMT